MSTRHRHRASSRWPTYCRAGSRRRTPPVVGRGAEQAARVCLEKPVTLSDMVPLYRRRSWGRGSRCSYPQARRTCSRPPRTSVSCPGAWQAADVQSVRTIEGNERERNKRRGVSSGDVTRTPSRTAVLAPSIPVTLRARRRCRPRFLRGIYCCAAAGRGLFSAVPQGRIRRLGRIRRAHDRGCRRRVDGVQGALRTWWGYWVVAVASVSGSQASAQEATPAFQSFSKFDFVPGEEDRRGGGFHAGRRRRFPR
jgi:hypothetical protein